jgi:hypothetical protein
MKRNLLPFVPEPYIEVSSRTVRRRFAVCFFWGCFTI